MNKVLVVLCVPVVLFTLVFLNYGAKTASVISKEIAPDVLLKKYSWFKDCMASLDSMQSNIGVMKARVDNLESAYEGVVRREWPRTDLETWSQINAELVGLKAAFNKLASKYNASMAKINFAFCNVGDLPKGADQVLPREFRTYLNN